MKITRLMCPSSKYDIKCPYEMTAEGICVHNTANKASAMAEVSYMINNNNKVSYHFAVDYERVVQAIEETRNTWNAGDGKNGRGNRKMISIEICHSTNEDINKFLESEKMAVKLIVYILKKYNWGIDKVYKHQDFSKKYCPHKTLSLGWERFLNMIKTELGETIISNEIVSNNNVSEWQTIMNKVYGSKLAVDNSYGPKSKAEANKHQLYYKKPVINNAYVGFVQTRLKSLKFYDGKIDNLFGPKTYKAVLAFQASRKLKADGFVGANTVRELLK